MTAGAAGEPSGSGPTATARHIRIRGVVQGVGFRPFVYRLAAEHGIAGWVLNAGEGVEVHAEGAPEAVARFAAALVSEPPPAASIAALEGEAAEPEGHAGFAIRESAASAAPTVRISPDLPVCDACLAELFDPADRRYGYPYLNCTDCGPRYTVILALPYDRPATTMAPWPLCADCAREYHDPVDRRFHAQPVACPACGPHYRLEELVPPPADWGIASREPRSPSASAAPRAPSGPGVSALGASSASSSPPCAAPPGWWSDDDHSDPQRALDTAAIAEAARRLAAGAVLGVKGLGGYHLACAAEDEAAVRRLRERKFRKEKPFAVMARDLAAAREVVDLSPEAEELLTSAVRPIVLAPARRQLPGVAPDNRDVGVMLPYAPVHHLLFAVGAPDLLVMTSANRSSEPIAYRDDDARERLAGLADALLVGERPIARRVDDSVVRAGPLGPTVLRRARGLAPGAVARLPVERPVLAVGADLKCAVTLVVGGEAFVGQHLGDLEQWEVRQAFRETVADLTAMYRVDPDELLVVHDLHPGYATTAEALEIPAAGRRAVQHHRAHVASVLAERSELETTVVGIALDGTGWGDDGTIWGGELFVGSVAEGFERRGRLYPATLPGGDAAARPPEQAAAGFLAGLAGLPDLAAPPFRFGDRYRHAAELAARGLRTFRTTSAGRLFDTVAALLGFTRPTTFEGQAAIWLEHLARGAPENADPLPMTWTPSTAPPAGTPSTAPPVIPSAAPSVIPSAARDLRGEVPDHGPSQASDTESAHPPPPALGELDYRPALLAAAELRTAGRPEPEIARAFHRGLAAALAVAAAELAEEAGNTAVVLSGGVFQNQLLTAELAARLAAAGLTAWTNRAVPPNDGGVSLGQAAIAAAGPSSGLYPKV